MTQLVFKNQSETLATIDTVMSLSESLDSINRAKSSGSHLQVKLNSGGFVLVPAEWIKSCLIVAKEQTKTKPTKK